MSRGHLITRDCPLCGSDANLSTLEMKARVPAEDQSYEILRDYFIGFRAEQCFFTYFRCGKCKLLWNPTYFSDDALSEIYSSMPPNSDVSGEVDTVRTQESYSNWFTEKISAQAKYLEIGADVGILSRAVISKFNVDSAFAVEPNLNVHGLLQQNLGERGTILLDIDDIALGIQFDLISMIHVLDHLPKPKLYLSKLRPQASINSQMLIVVHNEKSILRRLLGSRWAPFCLQHPQLFNPDTLSSLLDSNGFEVSRQGRTRNFISPKQLVSLAESIRMMPRGSSALFPSVSIPLRLGNTATVAQIAQDAQ